MYRLLSMSVIRHVLVLLCLLAIGHVQAAAHELAANRWTGIPRIVAFGDVHGAYAELVTALQAARVLDAELNWAGGDTHLVSLGDLVDRGNDSRAVLDLLMKLQAQALAAGGRVHVVMGNHELMNLTGDLRYVAPGEYAAFVDAETGAQRAAALADFVDDAADPEAARSDFDERYPPGYFGHRAGFAAGGPYGAWLLQRPLMVVLNENVFVHGGLPPLTARMPLEEINSRFAADVAEVLQIGARLADAGWIRRDADLLMQDNPVLGHIEQAGDSADPDLVAAARRFVALTRDELFGPLSPNWYRGTAHCHRTLELPVLNAALANLGAQRVVVGHTPTSNRRVQRRLDDRAVLADTGMLTSYYGGQPAPIVLTGSRFADSDLEILYPLHNETAHQADFVDPLQVHGLLPEALEALLASAPATLAGPGSGSAGDMVATITHGDDSFNVLFQPDSRQANSHKLAAYRLSRLLNLNLVPVTVARKLDGRDGVLIALPDDRITETARTNGNIGRSNWCGEGNDYQLMYAFDALIQNEGRTTDSMIYDQQSWQLFLIGHGSTFGSGTGFPKYLEATKKILPGMLREDLSALEESELLKLFDGLLGKRQIRTLLKRRDRLLQDWNEAQTQ